VCKKKNTERLGAEKKYISVMFAGCYQHNRQLNVPSDISETEELITTQNKEKQNIKADSGEDRWEEEVLDS
jgi:hypothetical protein